MKILLRLLRFADRYRRYSALAYVCLLAANGLGLAQPLIIQQVIDRGLGRGDAPFLVRAAGLLIVVNVAASLLTFAMTFLREYVSQRVSYDLRNALYDHLQRLALAYHDRARTGELMSRVTSDVDSARVFTGQGLLQIVNAAVLYATVLVLMFSLHWRLALLALGTLPFLAYTAVQYGTRVRPLYSRIQRQWAHLTAVLQENVTGVRVVKAFARERFEVDKFSAENQAYLERNVAAARLQAIVYPMMVVLTSLGTILILWYGGHEVIRGALTLGTLIAFNSYLARLAQPTRMLGYIIGWVSRATASGERLFEILDTQSPVRERPDATALPALEGRVVFDHVDFAYSAGPRRTRVPPTVRQDPYGGTQPGGQPRGERITDTGFVTPRVPRARGPDEAPTAARGVLADGGAPAALSDPLPYARPYASTTPRVLHDVCLEAGPDQVVALVGPTGAGKTTLVSLIPRFYDVTAGAVRIDGHDVRGVRLPSLRRQVGIVLQEPLLFSASVAENIAYGRPDAPRAQIERAARAAQADEFIADLPDGFDTRIGERGVTLSGGQRQRLAIARALLIDPRILILDDATASVDARTEFLIHRALQTLMKGRTTFVIAHRLTTIERADQILVMERGRIVQRGAHGPLVAVPGPYRELYDLQLRDQDEVLQRTGRTAPAVAGARPPYAVLRSTLTPDQPRVRHSAGDP